MLGDRDRNMAGKALKDRANVVRKYDKRADYQFY